MLLTCTLSDSPFPSLHLGQLIREYISKRGPLGIDFFILYRSKVHLENEFQVDLRCPQPPSRAATAILKSERERVTSEQEIYTPCQTATWEKSTGGAITWKCSEIIDMFLS